MEESTKMHKGGHSKISLVLKGAAMGIAEVIPGVSGGTIAFITGIYEDLIGSISSVDQHVISDIFKLRIINVWKAINGPFLLNLIIGMILGLLIGIVGVTKLLHSQPEILWALFFGLIVASIPLMLSKIEKKSFINLIPFIVSALAAFLITSISPAEGSTNLLYIFIAGMIAISAFVLPGISGSFILLLMGLYTVVIPTIKSFFESPEFSEFILLGVFAVGCLTGLALFSRVVSAAFKNYHDITIAIMSGFMFGSLNKIWPWRNPTVLLNKTDQSLIPVDADNIQTINILADDIKVIKETNVFPDTYFSDPQTTYVIIAFFVGLAIVGGLGMIQHRNQNH
jgi:putative membrane protein